MRQTAAMLRSEITEIRSKYDDVFAQYRDDEMPETVEDELHEMDAKLEVLIGEYSLRAQDERRAKDNRDAMVKLFRNQDEPQPIGDGARAPKTAELVTVGAQVLADPHFKAWLDNLTASGTKHVPSGVKVNSPQVDLSAGMAEFKALITGLSSTSGGALVVNDRLSLIVPAVRDELRVVDLLTHQSTNSDTVEYVRVTSETNAAAPTLEATTVATGGKPESAVALAVVTAIVETIAHWLPITRRALSDAGQLRAYIDDFLTFGLLDALNDQIVNGTGTTPELQGIDDLTGTQAQAWDTSILTTTRRARTKVRTVGGATPTAYLLHPTDWETIDLLQDAEQRYYFGGPQRVGTPVLWGLPVVEDEACTVGIGFVGDWRMGVVWDREQARIYMTDSHSDYFIRNIIVLLAELRAAVGWLRPAAFVEMDLTAA